MEELPTILITNGWKTDRNRKLTSVVIPSTVDTYNPPTKITFLGNTLSWIPSNASTLQEFVAANIVSVSSNLFTSYTALQSIHFPLLSSLSNTVNKFCYGCTSLSTITLESLTSIISSGNTTGAFCGCTSLVTINLPSLTSISDTGSPSGAFMNCTSLTTVNLPKLQSIVSSKSNGGAFKGCTGLQSVTLGSAGNPVTSLDTYTFNGCTQSNLTITIYTEGGASLSGEKWGATNATIVYETA